MLREANRLILISVWMSLDSEFLSLILNTMFNGNKGLIDLNFYNCTLSITAGGQTFMLPLKASVFGNIAVLNNVRCLEQRCGFTWGWNVFCLLMLILICAVVRNTVDVLCVILLADCTYLITYKTLIREVKSNFLLWFTLWLML